VSDVTLIEQRAPTAFALVELAIQKGSSIEHLERLMAMQERWEANEARKAFVAAMAAFKKNPPEIVKRKLVEFPSKGGKTAYMHATLGDVCAAVIEALAIHGFSHRWAMRSSPEGIYVKCVVTHMLGHAEEFEMGPGRPDESGGKNPIQAIASTNTYFQRYSLLGLCGLTSNDQRDDDGRGADNGFRMEEWIEAFERAEDMVALKAEMTRGWEVVERLRQPEVLKEFQRHYNQRRYALDPEYRAHVDKIRAEREAREPGSDD
jgi:hypothetical protein